MSDIELPCTRTRKMRPSAFVFPALALLAGTASAQSAVTVFGIIDATLRDVKNGSAGSLKSLTSGGYNNSRLGFRGTEDLGSDLQAAFWLEHGFSVDSGQPADASKFWNRRSTVSLIGKSSGEIRLGRDFSPSYTAFASVDPFQDNGLGGIGSQVNQLGSGALTITRSDNLVSYLLPDTLGGVFGQMGVAPGENTVGARYAGVNLGWRNANLRVVGTYGETTITNDKYKQAMVGGSYDLGVVKVSGEILDGRYRVSKQRFYFLGLIVPVGSGLFRASYGLSDLKGPPVMGQALSNADDASRLTLGYVYNLSKRTFLYGTVSNINNKGASKLVLAGGVPTGIRAGESSRGMEFGLRHAF